MVSIIFSAPMGLAILSLALFYLSNSYRQQLKIGWFECFFFFGNLFALATLNLIYGMLQTGSIPFSNTVLPIFQALLFVYLFAVIVVFFKLWRFTINYIFQAVKVMVKWR
jgi:hypothetical protein